MAFSIANAQAERQQRDSKGPAICLFNRARISRTSCRDGNQQPSGQLSQLKVCSPVMATDNVFTKSRGLVIHEGKAEKAL